MEKEKISIVIVVLNEEKTIHKLLDSLHTQTRSPDEIVIVDGGSKDKTKFQVRFNRTQIEKKKPNIKLFVEPEMNIAASRNYGVKQAKGEIVAMIDAGCTAHKNWLKKITQPFIDKSVDVVAGFYLMTGESSIQKAFKAYLGVLPNKFDPLRFLPSARSMAFRKSLWQKVGGFDERFEKGGEDTHFNYKVVKQGAKIVRVKEALVDWEVPGNLWEGLKKFYTYAKGDGQSQRLSIHSIKIIGIFSRYFFGLLLFALIFKSEGFMPLLFLSLGFLAGYSLFSYAKVFQKTQSFRAALWAPIVQILSDFFVMAGFTYGILSRHR